MSTSVDGVSSYTSVNEATTTYGGSELDRESFLNLLVTQLQYQDPLEPQANAEFVAQLAQFSSLEQLTNANDALEALYAALASMNNASMTQLLGTWVTAESDGFYFDGSGDATMYYELDGDASAVEITIEDSDGNVVYTEEIGAADAGENSFTWDGTTTSGTKAEEGTYTFSVSATDVDGEDVAVTTLIKGEIDGMNYESGAPVPSIHGVEIELGAILDVRSSSSEAGDEDEASSEAESSPDESGADSEEATS